MQTMNSTETQVEKPHEPMRIGTDSSKRIEQRKYKDRAGRYGLELTLTLTLGSAEFCGRCADKRCNNSREELTTIAAGLPFAKAYCPASYWHHYHEECPECKWSNGIIRGVTLEFWLPADRPSDILSESQAQMRIAKQAPENAERGYGSNQERPLTMEQILIARVEASFTRFQRDIKRAEIAEQASRIAGWAAQEADKAARAEVKWSERLAALKAELIDRQAVCLARILADEMAGKLADHEEEWHPKAVELGQAAAASLMPAPIPSIMGNTDYRGCVKLTDVPEEIEEN